MDELCALFLEAGPLLLKFRAVAAAGVIEESPAVVVVVWVKGVGSQDG
jgi:hypothetical protein